MDDIERRAEMFSMIVDRLEGKDIVDNIYHMITTYGIPAIADEEFLIASLMKVYLDAEEYEKCSILQKGDFKRNVSYDSLEDLDEETSAEDIKYLVLMGFIKSINITTL